MSSNGRRLHDWLWISSGAALLGLGALLGFIGLLVGIDEAFAAKQWFLYAFAAMVSGLLVLTLTALRALLRRR